MGELVESLLAKEVIEEVHAGTPVFFRHVLLGAQEGAGVWCAILYLSTLNKFMRKEKFQMETTEKIREQLKQGEWATLVDPSDAYHIVPIH